MNGPVPGKEQAEAVQVETCGNGEGEHAGQNGQMNSDLFGNYPAPLRQGDASAHIVDRQDHDHGCQHRKTGKRLEYLQEWQAEQVEAEVLSHHRISRADRDHVCEEEHLFPLRGAPDPGKNRQNRAGENAEGDGQADHLFLFYPVDVSPSDKDVSLGQLYPISKVHVDHGKEKQQSGKEQPGTGFCRQRRGEYLGKPGLDEEEPVCVIIEQRRKNREKHRTDNNDENEFIFIGHHGPLYIQPGLSVDQIPPDRVGAVLPGSHGGVEG